MKLHIVTVIKATGGKIDITPNVFKTHGRAKMLMDMLKDMNIAFSYSEVKVDIDI